MPKYMINARYTAEGAKGLLKDGGTKRRTFVQQLTERMGGKLEAFYFTFGDSDAVLIVDLPDAASVAAISMNVGASGAVRCSTTPLMTCEEMDQAAKKKVGYKAPGA